MFIQIKFHIFKHNNILSIKKLFVNSFFINEPQFNIKSANELGSVHIKSELKIKASEMVEIEIESSLS